MNNCANGRLEKGSDSKPRALSPFRFRGGTVVEVWTPNATLTKGECKYVDGNATADFAGQGFSSRPGGSLFTGMIAL